MAQHCLFYAIEYDAQDGEAWYTGVQGRFRDTPEGANARYEMAVRETPPEYSVRLIAVRVLQQRDASK